MDQSLKAMADSQDLATKRSAFLPLSQELGQVVMAAADYLSIPVYEAKCPMAFDNAGGTWLQRERAIRNPYFGIQMLRCGDVVGTLAFDPALSAQVASSIPVGSGLGRDTEVVTPVALYQADNLGALTSAYFQLADALTAGDHVQAKARVLRVQESLNAVKVKAQDGKPAEAWARSAANLTTAVEAIGKSTDLEQARQGFALLSEELAAVLRAGGGADSPVYRVKCPMAFNNRGATWLQGEKKVTNPYFGDRMLRCGSVVETLSVRPPAPGPTAPNGKEHQHD